MLICDWKYEQMQGWKLHASYFMYKVILIQIKINVSRVYQMFPFEGEGGSRLVSQIFPFFRHWTLFAIPYIYPCIPPSDHISLRDHVHIVSVWLVILLKFDLNCWDSASVLLWNGSKLHGMEIYYAVYTSCWCKHPKLPWLLILALL